jgi:glycosyltransferase involved in cell wall biosynthesis
MRVLVISAAFPPMQAGEATNAYFMCRQLADRGLEVHVLTSRQHQVVAEPGITVHPLMRTWSWAEYGRLVAFLKECAPDVVYLMYLGWTYNRQFMVTFTPTIVKRVLPRCTFVTRFENVGGADAPTNSLASRAIRKLVATLDARGGIDYHFGTLLRDSDAIALLSGRHEQIIERHCPGVGAKCQLIPPPSNMRVVSKEARDAREQGRKALGAAPDDFVLAYIGFIYPGKGIETLLAAAKAVSRDRKQLRLAIIGGGLANLEKEYPGRPRYVDEMHKLADELGLNGRVAWTGDFSYDTDAASILLRGADACVLPFDTGVKLNNSSFSSAAAHGLPIITTRDDLLEKQFVHGDNVYLCAPRSPDDLSTAIRALIDDGALRERLAAGSERLAQEWYAWPTAVNRTMALFNPPATFAARPLASTT